MSQIRTSAALPSTPTGQRDPSQRTWAFTHSVTGLPVTVTCMPGCELDHSSDIETPTHPDDIWCQAPGTAIELPLFGPLCDSSAPEEFQVFGFGINVRPFAKDYAARLPHVSLEVVDDHLIEYLDPDALATVINKVQQQLTELRAAHDQLVRVRAEYAARDARVEQHVDQIITALAEAKLEVSA